MIVQEPIQVGVGKHFPKLSRYLCTCNLIMKNKTIFYLQVIVWDCLNNYEFDNAVFLAERLHAEGEDHNDFRCTVCREKNYRFSLNINFGGPN